ncbi:hypothetical protein JM16_009411 [Phytophthora kernoviae]|uniref:Uncharacterized protein n=1 Tax=Phytophthora kernoviae TaxID=325452 RepID=A0A8T0LKW2_9STRA|nr:hypothetical protein JM16_009411 [Phytophthora kernoviae]
MTKLHRRSIRYTRHPEFPILVPHLGEPTHRRRTRCIQHPEFPICDPHWAVPTHPRAILARYSAESNDHRQIHCTRHPASPTAHRLAVSTPKTLQLMVPPAAEATLDRHH